ncbi:hypothetical protein PIB30_089837 [Stylosanthes scabra]|uniref:RRM domain-containing protein n=1 Tax=Stylosanthes scabra TaxID=79078 RepID=A0ABU6ZTE8_9FABA|nr:hypothetical protein [Stylosanthes scabra]
MRDGERRWSERQGKHGQVSGYAGESYKGESGGGFVSGGWKIPFGLGGWKQRKAMDEVTTIFVDNLPVGVTKRELYLEFGRDGYVADIFVSRKQRMQTTNLFAFINFKDWGVIQRQPKQKWVEVRKVNRNASNIANNEAWKEKEARVEGSINRSVLGCCTQPIKFRKTMNHLLDNWTGPGEIECRDVVPIVA